MPDKSPKSRRYAGLKPAQKGERRNPTGSNGATKRRAEDAALMKEILERDWVHDKEGKHVKATEGRNFREAMFEVQILKALKGDTLAFNSIMDIARGGKLPQTVNVESDGDAITGILWVRNIAADEKNIGGKTQ